MKKYISLKDNEELIIGSYKNKKSISIKNKDNILHITEIEPCDIEDNIEINEINFDALKNFFIFEFYYQEMSSLNVGKKIMEKVNEILNYHYENIYGKKYNTDYSNIIDTTYQAITTFEDN